MERREIAIANPYADWIGFSRAVRVGPFVAVDSDRLVEIEADAVIADSTTWTD